MPKNKVSDPITDQEIAFARLVLSGAMTDRQAAEAVGLSPDSAAYTKAKPHVRAYMLEHRAAVDQQLVQQDVAVEHRLHLDREQVLNRLWELANLSPEMTRGSITGQVKALSMIIAMENFIPDRRAVDRLAIPSEKKSAPVPTPRIHTSAWLRRHQAKAHTTTNDPQPGPALNQHADSPCVSEPAPGPVAAPPPNPGRTQSTSANRSTPSEAPKPYVPLFTAVPDLGVDFSIKTTPLNPFVRPR
jgi:hypothetical protein